ncbi:MAG: PQQ-binding-like beta-propeller repeat protein [Calditrichaeota bacterium]|nr:PQQ-binding-like beta-propeller repeat protein [Calditrichota bacterium]
MKILLALIVSLYFIISCSQDNSFRFVLFSDTHVAENTTGAADLELAVRDVNQLRDVDFVLVSGDITDMNIGNNLHRAKEILDSLNVPYYIIPGNHDTKWSGSAGANFRQIWPDDQFVFDYQNYRFIGFHQGPILRMDDGHIPREDLYWLKEQLQETGTEKPVILVMHYPLNDAIDNWNECVDIIKDYNIKLIIHGHGHRNRQSEYQGIPAVMGRSTLRARAEHGGFNIFTCRDDSMIVQEKTTGGRLNPAWTRVSLAGRAAIQSVPDSLLADMSVNTAYPDVKNKWTFESGYTTTASPVVANDTVYIADVSGKIRALSLADGKELWDFNSGGSVYATVAANQDRVIFNSADSNICCVDKNTNEVAWKLKTENNLVAVPLVHNDIVYSGSSDGTFRAIDLYSGELIWLYDKVGGYVETKPLFYKNKIIFGAWDGKLYALNTNDGSEAWIWQGEKTSPLYSPAACWPVAANNKVFVAAPDRVLSAINAETGETVWRNNSWKFRETVGLSEDGNRVYARSMTDSVVCFDTKTQKDKVIWANDFGYGYDIAPSMPVEKNGTLFWGTKNGLIIAADAENGALKWKHRINNYMINTVCPVDENRVLYSNIDGQIGLLSVR